jgi:hypothetical protein
MTLSSNTVIKVLLTVLDHVFIGIRAFGVFVALTSPVFGAKESIVQAYDILSSSFGQLAKVSRLGGLNTYTPIFLPTKEDLAWTVIT